MTRARFRDIGLTIGNLPTGPLNAITDVAGVEVGYSTQVHDTPNVVRTGVTAIWPRRDIWSDFAFAGVHSFNGCGEMTGLSWLAEQGLLTTPIVLTNTYAVGTAWDAVCSIALQQNKDRDPALPLPVRLPVVAETYDGVLNAIDSQPVTKAMVLEALDYARAGPVAEGNVGGGTGMLCHEFKGGTGTSSRKVPDGYTVGVLVQANYGRRDLLRAGGAPVGAKIGYDEVPPPGVPTAEAGSIIVVIATDAPLLPLQCSRLARRATTGLGWVGGIGANGSGDIFIAFSTANHIGLDAPQHGVTMLQPSAMTSLFEAVAEATEEAILNALTSAETMTGAGGQVAHAIPLDRLRSIVTSFQAAGPSPSPLPNLEP